MKKLIVILALLSSVAVLITYAYVPMTIMNILLLLMLAALVLANVMLIAFRLRYFIAGSAEYSKLYKTEFINKTIDFLAPFKLHLPAKIILLHKYVKINLTNAASAVSIEFALENTFLVFMSLLALLIVPKIFPTTLLLGLLVLVLFIIITIALIITTLILGKNLSSLIEKMSEIKILRRVMLIIYKFVHSLETGIKELFLIRKTVFLVMGLTVLVFTSGAIKTWLVFKIFSIEIPIIYVFLIAAVASLLGVISMIPGGLGIRELTSLAMYTPLGIPIEPLTAALVFDRITTYIFIFVIGCYIISDLGFTNLKKILTQNKETPIHNV